MLTGVLCVHICVVVWAVVCVYMCVCVFTYGVFVSVWWSQRSNAGRVRHCTKSWPCKNSMLYPHFKCFLWITQSGCFNLRFRWRFTSSYELVRVMYLFKI